MTSPGGETYAGDVSVEDSFALIRGAPGSRLVDVRTPAEWTYVGIPDLSGIGRELLLVSWLPDPATGDASAFVAELSERLQRDGVAPDAPLLFICRSGVRSRSAAIAMTKAGFQRCLNVAGGFEGPLDADRHRGTLDGWKAKGLPWVQS